MAPIKFYATNRYQMGRNNEKNIKTHNDKLHKAQQKKKNSEALRKQKLSEIIKKHTQSKEDKS
jgi:hypothetical protein